MKIGLPHTFSSVWIYLFDCLSFCFILCLALQALTLQARYQSSGDPSIVQQLQSMLGDGMADPSTQLTAAHVFLSAGMKKEALQCVHLGTTLAHISCTLQIYLQLDRLDLAQNQLKLLRQSDEDSVLTQLGGVHIALAAGSSLVKDAIHTLNQLSEQYGPSVFLLNLMACAYLQAGQYAQAESKLEQARQEFGATNDADTLVNLIVAYQYQQKPTGPLVEALKTQFPNHFLAKGLEMVEGAFEREATKYRVAA
jgi:coatomer protein complex subunit epsilon